MNINRAQIIAGNWKMNHGPHEALEYFQSIRKALPESAGIARKKLVIFPVAYCLTSAIQAMAKLANFELGAQNVHWETKGAFTGELSASVLQSMEVHWALIAHSERRQYFGETDETASKRFLQAAKLGVNIIYCIGENLKEREAGKTEAILSAQLSAFSKAVLSLGARVKADVGTRMGARTGTSAETEAKGKSTSIWAIAYEPVWAIGTGKTATPEQAQAVHAFIRKSLEKKVSEEFAADTPILYGGSVTPQNTEALVRNEDVDGVLVGGASLKPDEFAKIIKAAI